MTDQAMQMLHRAFSEVASGQKILWVVGESFPDVDISEKNSSTDFHAISNRFDSVEALAKSGFTAIQSDFDFHSYDDNTFDAIFYRVAKEKAAVHHIINAVARILKPSGRLHLAGYKKDGIKTYASKAKVYLGGISEQLRGPKTSLMVSISMSEDCGEPLEDKAYTDYQSVSYGQHSFATKPGIFGWDKIDQGSCLLIEQLPAVLSSLKSEPEVVIDLGCGYGFLTVMASQWLTGHFLSTDNNVTAVAACEKNLLHYKINGEVILDDCAASITTEADMVLCNPPFHQGFDVDGGLTDKFISNTKRLLKPPGIALFVVNSFIPLERKAKTLFNTVETIVDNGRFKIVKLG